MICESCKHAMVVHSLSGDHLSCCLDVLNGGMDDSCFYHIEAACPVSMTGLYAHEQKHNFFSEEEFTL